MSTISLRIPNSIHSRVKTLSKEDGVSVNQFITVALTEKLSVMNAEEYFLERAQRGNRQKFEAVLAKVPGRKPFDFDAISKD